MSPGISRTHHCDARPLTGTRTWGTAVVLLVWAGCADRSLPVLHGSALPRPDPIAVQQTPFPEEPPPDLADYYLGSEVRFRRLAPPWPPGGDTQAGLLSLENLKGTWIAREPDSGYVLHICPDGRGVFIACLYGTTSRWLLTQVASHPGANGTSLRLLFHYDSDSAVPSSVFERSLMLRGSDSGRPGLLHGEFSVPYGIASLQFSRATSLVATRPFGSAWSELQNWLRAYTPSGGAETSQ